MRSVLVVLILVGGFAAASASAIPNDGADPTVIQNISSNITTGAVVEVAGDNENGGLPMWTSILPPLLAIVLALLFRHVLVALLLGVWLGAFLISGLSPVVSFARSACCWEGCSG